MGRALSSRLLERGHHITLVSHTPGKAEALVEELENLGKDVNISVANPNSLPGDVVILSVPYTAALSVVQQYFELLPGKILVDITNPINYQTMEMVVQGESAAEKIAQVAPKRTPVVKAFNTVFAKSLLDKQVDCAPLDVFIASDDAKARATIKQLVEDLGLNPVDVGQLKWARQLESVEQLHMAIQTSNNLGFKSAIKIVR
ncbi:MAG TPA: NAD(P)-binding domain-containing protein [Anaerolineales bacterium]|nr:NAD(P)-binding domain-containing protein [Anaerolineales bacterium]